MMPEFLTQTIPTHNKTVETTEREKLNNTTKDEYNE
jgi:hypothetical protein